MDPTDTLPPDAQTLEQFRLAMRKLAASVHLVTTEHEGEKGGLTATAVCSVSFDPMVMLACVNRSASCFDLIERAGRFAITLLSAEDTDVALQFGAPDQMVERFGLGDWDTLKGLPVLASGAAAIALETMSHQDVGTHRVYYGKVMAVQVADGERATLLYENGGFATCSALRQ